jgi:hypothetical protein
MNKPFGVCLLPVLPLSAEALAQADEYTESELDEALTAFAQASAVDGKGRLQTGD